MDGRRFRKWLLSGCLAAGATGCHRNAVRSPVDPQVGGQPVAGMPTTQAKKPLFGSSPPQPTFSPDPPPEKVAKGPPKPETIVAIADVKLGQAFDEKTDPATRQALLDVARQEYQKALQQDPKNKAALLALARFYTRIGEREKAVEVFKKYLTHYPKDHDAAHEVALAHAQWKDWDGAVAWCEFALRIDPENLTARKTMAFCLCRAGRWDDGLQVMMRVMSEPQARYLVARAMEHQRLFAASRQQLQLALRADPQFGEAQEFLAELEQVMAGTAPDGNALRQAGFDQPVP